MTVPIGWVIFGSKLVVIHSEGGLGVPWLEESMWLIADDSKSSNALLDWVFIPNSSKKSEKEWETRQQTARVTAVRSKVHCPVHTISFAAQSNFLDQERHQAYFRENGPA